MNDERAKVVQKPDAEEKYLVIVAGSGNLRGISHWVVASAPSHRHAFRSAGLVAGDGFSPVAAIASGGLMQLAQAVAGISVQPNSAVNLTADPNLRGVDQLSCSAAS